MVLLMILVFWLSISSYSLILVDVVPDLWWDGGGDEEASAVAWPAGTCCESSLLDSGTCWWAQSLSLFRLPAACCSLFTLSLVLDGSLLPLWSMSASGELARGPPSSAGPSLMLLKSAQPLLSFSLTPPLLSSPNAVHSSSSPADLVVTVSHGDVSIATGASASVIPIGRM